MKQSLSLPQQFPLCQVLGNGPSAALVNLPRLAELGIPCIGMNAAYRYWITIDFRPTFYICMDETVVVSHCDAIAELVTEGRIQQFFLHDAVLETVPSLQRHASILWFNEMRENHAVFQTDYVTTGSWAIRWAAHMGFMRILLSGVDSNYVEQIAESTVAEISGAERLIIEKTPQFNPNYFFPEYQQEGDKYNIPNEPKYTEQRGGLVHVDALRAVRNDLQQLNCGCEITDLSPLSTHGTFRKQSISKTYGALEFSAVIFLEQPKTAEDCKQVAAGLAATANSPWVSQLTVICKGSCQNHLSQLSSDCSALMGSDCKTKLRICGGSTFQSIEQILSAARPKPEPGGHMLLVDSSLQLGDQVFQKVFAELSGREQTYGVLESSDGAGRKAMEGLVLPPMGSVPQRMAELCPKSPDWVELAAALLQLDGCHLLSVPVKRDNSQSCAEARRIGIGHGDAPLKFTDAVLEVFRESPLVREFLCQSDELAPGVAWLGREGALTPWSSLMEIAGFCGPSLPAEKTKVVFHKMHIDRDSAEESRGRLRAIFEKRNREVPFLEWEVEGEGEIEQILNEEMREFFLHHPLQSLVNEDHATAKQQQVLATFVMVAKEILLRVGQVLTEAKKEIRYPRWEERAAAPSNCPPSQENECVILVDLETGNLRFKNAKLIANLAGVLLHLGAQVRILAMEEARGLYPLVLQSRAHWLQPTCLQPGGESSLMQNLEMVVESFSPACSHFAFYYPLQDPGQLEIASWICEAGTNYRVICHISGDAGGGVQKCSIDAIKAIDWLETTVQKSPQIAKRLILAFGSKESGESESGDPSGPNMVVRIHHFPDVSHDAQSWQDEPAGVEFSSEEEGFADSWFAFAGELLRLGGGMGPYGRAVRSALSAYASERQRNQDFVESWRINQFLHGLCGGALKFYLRNAQGCLRNIK